MNFFKGIFRLVKIALVSTAILLIILLLESFFHENNAIFNSIIVGFIGVFIVCVANSFGAETLDLSWLNNGFGTFIKRALFFISWIIALLIQVTSLSDAIDNALLGNSFFGDIAILCFVFAPFAAIYMCCLVSNSDIDVSSMTFFPLMALIFGAAAGLVFEIIFNVIPALQGTEIWLIPVLSNVSFIIFMIIRQELPYTDFSTSTSKAKSRKTKETYQSPPQEDDEETDSRKALWMAYNKISVEMSKVAYYVQIQNSGETVDIDISNARVDLNIDVKIRYYSIYFTIRPCITNYNIEDMGNFALERALNLYLEKIGSVLLHSAEEKINKLRKKYKNFDKEYSIDVTIDPIHYK